MYREEGKMNKIFEKILNEISLDSRVSDGIFNIENNEHMEVFREYFIKKGHEKSLVNEFSNLVLEKGNFPERQAYNKETGILVTFPTPTYKAAAIKRGTHVEEDPMKTNSNLFSDPSKTTSPTTVKDNEPKTEPKTSLPVSQASAAPSAGSESPPSQVQPQTTAAPQQTPVSTPDSEPVKEPTELPPPKIIPPIEKEANKQAIKAMLKGDDYMLQEIVEFINYNAPHIMEEIKKKLKT